MHGSPMYHSRSIVRNRFCAIHFLALALDIGLALALGLARDVRVTDGRRVDVPAHRQADVPHRWLWRRHHVDGKAGWLAGCLAGPSIGKGWVVDGLSVVLLQGQQISWVGLPFLSIIAFLALTLDPI